MASTKKVTRQTLERDKRIAVRESTSELAEISSIAEGAPNRAAATAIEAKLEEISKALWKINQCDEGLVEFIDESLNADAKQKAEIELIKDYEEIKKKYVQGMGKLKLIRELMVENTPDGMPSPRRSFNSSFIDATLVNPLIKLQDVPVPVFDGSFQSFPDWYGEFVTVVDKNESFDEFQKLYLLKRAMGEGAKHYVTDIGTDGAVYKATFQSLYNTFFQKRRIINAHFSDIVDFPNIQNSQLRDSIEKVKRSLRGLQVCGIDSKAISPLVAFLMSRKISPKMKDDWLNSNHDYSEFPSFESLAAFLINRSFSVEVSSNKGTSSSQPKSEAKSTSKVRNGTPNVEKKVVAAGGSSSSQGSSYSVVCVVCKQNHFLDLCPEFLQKSVNDRFLIVKNNRLCLKCFKPNHSVASCTRNVKCNLCSGNHHKLLHRNFSNRSDTVNDSSVSSGASTVAPATQTQSATTNVGSTCSLGTSKKVFLATAVVNVQGANGNELGRLLIDQGSEMTLITKEFCDRAKLKLVKKAEPTKLIGITTDSIEVNWSVKCVLRSRFSNYSIAIMADVVSKIPYTVNKSDMEKVIEGFTYDFGESCELPYESVDILLGSEYAEFILTSNRHFVDGLVFRESYFGYVVTGSSTKCSFFGEKSSYCGLSNSELSEQFRRFVCLDEVSESKREKIVEHDLIDSHFEDTYSIDENTNKFVIRLPVKESVRVLEGSFGKACAMLKNSERRRSEIAQRAYVNIFNEYLSLNHMTKISRVPDLNAYYLPHHLVSKTSDPESHRLVFNASFIDDSGTSLNTHLLEGPKIQPDLTVNVTRFRMHVIGYTCDIFRMYRCILVHPDDRIYQRIVFRFCFHDEIDIYELNTLTNGIGPASYIAPKCLKKIASFVRETYPEVAEVLENDFYMDNESSGGKTVEEAVSIRERVHEVLLKYGFPLRKYQSNSSEFLSSIPVELIDTLKSNKSNGKKFVYVLGLIWYVESDELAVDIRSEPLPSVVTKRVMLSIISKTFDILGMLTPVMIRAKILLQELWKEGRNWDEEISNELKEEFEEFCKDLSELSAYAIPRCYFNTSEVSKCQLIGYCDASTRALCAVVYVRSIDFDQNVKVSFVCSKSRIAPIKPVDIHRLELGAAVLLAKLVNRISSELLIEEIYCFSDSQVALSWIKSDPLKLKQFISNRVTIINSLVNKDRWFYVEGRCNPADLGTRGLSSSKFVTCENWKIGPSLLHENEEFDNCILTKFQPVEKLSEMKEEKSSCLIVNRDHPILSLLERKSSLYTCISVLGLVLRYVRNLKAYCRDKRKGIFRKLHVNSTDIRDKRGLVKPLEVSERDDAFDQIIRVSQYEGFSNECDKLNTGLPISKRSKLCSLDVFLDTKGIVRARGRTSNASFSYDTKYPIVLPAKSRFMKLYIQSTHVRYFHATKSFVINFVRSKFWVVGGLIGVVKGIVRKCVLCARVNAECRRQVMGDLPEVRISIARPFSKVGVDLTGAVNLKCTNHRSITNYKVYLVFFVCLTTRAVHVEMVEDLTTEAFLNTLERFVSRRGLPQLIYSDNATNFVGSRNVLKESENSLSRYLNVNHIEWKTIAPRSPHQGGIWEAAVKSGKQFLKKAIGSQRLNLFELNTIASKVEAILNARPIAYRRNDSFVETLTPGHFLIGSAMFEPPIDEEAKGVKIKQRYFLWRRIVDSFWSTWRRDYVNQLRNRTKWKEVYKNLKVGDVVLVSSKNEGVFSWPLGIIEIVFPDNRGFVRNVSVRLKGGEIRKTSIQNLVLLPVESDSDVDGE